VVRSEMVHPAQVVTAAAWVEPKVAGAKVTIKVVAAEVVVTAEAMEAGNTAAAAVADQGTMGIEMEVVLWAVAA